MSSLVGSNADGERSTKDKVTQRAGSTTMGGKRDAPGWLETAESWHDARRRPIPVIGDATITAVVAGAVTDSPRVGILCAGVLVLAGLVFGLFKPRMNLETQGVVWYPVPLFPTVAIIFVVLLTRFQGTTNPQALEVAVAIVAGLTGTRTVLWLMISSARRRGAGLRPTLIVGPADRIDQLTHRLRTFPEAGLVFEGSHVPTGNPDSHDPTAGRALIERLLSEHPVHQILCVVDSIDEAVFRDVVRFGGPRVDCGLVVPVPGILGNQTKAHIGDMAVIPIRCSPSWGSSVAKRAFDLVVATIGLIVISPLLALTALAVRLGDHGPAIFCQSRVGRNGKNFKLYKFRSMIVDAESHRDEHLEANINTGGLLFKLENDPRITPVGAVIRRLSIDELPQLVNVIKGEMSLVGPRPLPVDPEEFDISAQIRHRVAPGITGLWQVHGANALPYGDMVDLDLTYVTTHSFGLDLVLLARTLPALIFRRSAY